MKQQLALLAALIITGGAAIPDSQPPATPTHTIIFHETPAEFTRRNGPDSAKYWAEWGRYIQSIQASGKMVGGSALLPPQQDHTFGNSRALERGTSRVSGFLTITAKTHAEALALAKDSPAIRTGGAVEVRAHVPMMETGVSK